MQSTKTDGHGSQPAWSRETNQPTMTTIIQRELDDFSQQNVRRTRVVGRLIFLQAALLLMIAPLAVWPHPEPLGIGVVIIGFLLYAFAWVRNISGNTMQAQTLLIVGSGVLTALNMFGQIFWHPADIVPVGLASLPFVLTILEAGLLFLPEIALMTAVACAATTVIALIATLIVKTGTQEYNSYLIYLVAVSSLGLQSLSGIIAWQISHFIMDFSSELAKVRRDEFISTQFDALRRSVDEQSARLRDQIIVIVNGIMSLTSRDYTARVSIPESAELRPIADTMNLLASQLGSVASNDQMNVGLINEAMQINEIAGQIIVGDPTAGAMSQLPMSSAPSGSLLNSTVVTLNKARGALQQRMGQMRELAFEAGQRLKQADERTVVVEQHIAENLATIGLLRAEADRIYGSANRLNQLIDEALRALSGFLPSEVTDQARIESHETHAAASLQSVMPGITIQFDTISDDTEFNTADVAQHTAQSPAGQTATSGTADATAQLKLRETWSKLVEMTEEVAKQVRDALVLQEKLGITSKSIRGVDNGLIQLRGIVNTVLGIAEQLYLTSNMATTPLTGPYSGEGSASGFNISGQQNPPSAPYNPTQYPTSTPSGPSQHINAADLIDSPDTYTSPSTGPYRPPEQ